MPEHYVIAKNVKKGGILLMTHDEWLEFKYSAGGDEQPEWEQASFEPEYWPAIIHLYEFLQSKLDTHFNK